MLVGDVIRDVVRDVFEMLFAMYVVLDQLPLTLVTHNKGFIDAILFVVMCSGQHRVRKLFQFFGVDSVSGESDSE